jgi:hypothetical protein
MKRALAAGLMSPALVGCIGPRGGHYVGGDASVAIFDSQGRADGVCREHLPYENIWPPSHPLAHGLSAEEQLRRHYRICMTIMGYPNADLEPAVPVAPVPN